MTPSLEEQPLDMFGTQYNSLTCLIAYSSFSELVYEI